MPRYTFTFKKDDIFVEFTTEDMEVVERQFQIWVADADDYARHNKTKSKQEVPEKIQPEIESKNELVEPVVSANEPIIESEKTEVIQDEIQPSVEDEKIEPQAFDKASSLLKTINSIQNEQSVQSDEKKEETVDFESVLEKSIENPTFEPDKVKDQVFLNLVKSKNTTDKFHYLLIAAYYLSEFEKLERFSLKQVNAKLMQNLAEVIDSSTLQAALTQNLLEMVPDLTGMSEVAEYRLTREGEEFFANKI